MQKTSAEQGRHRDIWASGFFYDAQGPKLAPVGS
jgi:hypothetical protein